MRPLSKSFFEQDAVEVAKGLLGKLLVVNGIKARIVETEAYGRDPASHAFQRTERSAMMFDTFGYVYVYLIYGLYNCVNITTNKIGEAGAVLIRAVEPLSGINKMKERRKTDKIIDLCSGPGKLCLALGIDKKMNGLPLSQKINLFDDGFKVEEMGTSARIGVKVGLDLPWRFFIKSNPFVSKY